MPTIGKSGLLRWLVRAPVYLYRWGFGPLLGRLLTHIGRRTGLRHQTVLEIMEYRTEGSDVVVMSGFGRHPDWLRNIETTAAEEVTIGSQRFIASASIAERSRGDASAPQL
jgi:deazaflavin-dependent oxidoreductase (nitroreductase family)